MIPRRRTRRIVSRFQKPRSRSRADLYSTI